MSTHEDMDISDPPNEVFNQVEPMDTSYTIDQGIQTNPIRHYEQMEIDPIDTTSVGTQTDPPNETSSVQITVVANFIVAPNPQWILSLPTSITRSPVIPQRFNTYESLYIIQQPTMLAIFQTITSTRPNPSYSNP